jgi:hypothetical protein
MEPALNTAKLIIVEGIGLSSLLLAGIALLLIEFWGIKVSTAWRKSFGTAA